MLVINNFRETQPTEKQIKTFSATGIMPKFLRSEDGQDWYECQSQFSDDKIKIMFDSAGIVRSVVDKPVADRGNTLAVSMFFPVNMSVAEIDGTLPDGFSINGDWVFDGENVVKRTKTQDELVAEAERTKSRLLAEAESVIAPLERSVKYNMATEAESQLLKQWSIYTVLLSRVDTRNAPDIDWPKSPV